MLSLKSSYTTAILVLSVLASLTTGQDSQTSFTLHQTESKFAAKSGPAAVLSTYHKFNRRAPESVQNAAAINRGTVIASPSKSEAGYLSPVTIGGQTLNLLIDTGSDFLWVYSSDFASAVDSTYNNTISNTSRLQEGQSWHRCYGDETCDSGDVYTETVSVGGIIVNNQTIGVVREITNYRETPFDGILGLSFNRNTMNLPQYISFFDNIKSTLSAPVVAADLKKGKPGSYDFGFIDNSKYAGEITYVPVDTSQGFWGFTLNGYAIDSENLNHITLNVIADTGNTAVLLPEEVVEAYYATVPSSFYNSDIAHYLLPCDTALPSITFDIGSYKAVIPGSYMKFSPQLDDDQSMFHQRIQINAQDFISFTLACSGGIQPAPDSGPFVLGNIFLKSQFVVFDAGDEPRLGFAAKPL